MKTFAIFAEREDFFENAPVFTRLDCNKAGQPGVGMGFYIRKSVSAGPFRFNLSGSGLGMSVGVRGFRLGTGPRGNYVHMGRGGLYYRASLGGHKRQPALRTTPRPAPPPTVQFDSAQQVIETGNVVEMVPSNGSNIVEQINEKLASLRLWPWVLGLGFVFAMVAAGQPAAQNLAGGIFLVALIGAAVAAYWDHQRRTVVILYDLEEATEKAFEALAKADCTPENRHRLLALAAPASLGGLPVLTVPVALPSGLTAGLQIIVPRSQSPAVDWVLDRFVTS